MPPATFDFGGKVVLVTGVGRAGQIGNAVALAFGTAGAKIVASDVNAVGVTERVREFAALGVDARPCAGFFRRGVRWPPLYPRRAAGRLSRPAGVLSGQ